MNNQIIMSEPKFSWSLSRFFREGTGGLFLLSLFTLFSLSSSLSCSSQDSVKIQRLFSKEAFYPGGPVAWNQFVNKLFSDHLEEFVNDGKTGTCRIKFLVSEDGTISDISALTMEDSQLAKISMQAILDGPKWVPAEYRGKKVKAWREVPITFNLKGPSP